MGWVREGTISADGSESPRPRAGVLNVLRCEKLAVGIERMVCLVGLIVFTYSCLSHGITCFTLFSITGHTFTLRVGGVSNCGYDCSPIPALVSKYTSTAKIILA